MSDLYDFNLAAGTYDPVDALIVEYKVSEAPTAADRAESQLLSDAVRDLVNMRNSQLVTPRDLYGIGHASLTLTGRTKSCQTARLFDSLIDAALEDELERRTMPAAEVELRRTKLTEDLARKTVGHVVVNDVRLLLLAGRSAEELAMFVKWNFSTASIDRQLIELATNQLLCWHERSLPFHVRRWVLQLGSFDSSLGDLLKESRGILLAWRNHEGGRASWGEIRSELLVVIRAALVASGMIVLSHLVKQFYTQFEQANLKNS